MTSNIAYHIIYLAAIYKGSHRNVDFSNNVTKINDRLYVQIVVNKFVYF